ncbi:MAG TPA: hypothetical protein VKY31_07720 [Terriglobia bacterium]|nr:hypothetical protein [Terriglobia bacterium]
MEFADRNEVEIQGIVDQILQIAANGLKWARQQESERLDEEQGFVEWGPGDKNDEGYIIEELADPLPTHLSIIKTILLLQSEPLGSDEENIVRFNALLSDRKITAQFIFNFVAGCCDFYAFGWMTRHIAGQPPFRAARRRMLANSDGHAEEIVAVAR